MHTKNPLLVRPAGQLSNFHKRHHFRHKQSHFGSWPKKSVEWKFLRESKVNKCAVAFSHYFQIKPTFTAAKNNCQTIAPVAADWQRRESRSRSGCTMQANQIMKCSQQCQTKAKNFLPVTNCWELSSVSLSVECLPADPICPTFLHRFKWILRKTWQNSKNRNKKKTENNLH